MENEYQNIITESTINKLTKLFSFEEYPLQDWEHLVTDSDRVLEFIEAFEKNKVKTNEEKLALMAIIIGSLDDGLSEDKKYPEDVWLKLEKIIFSELNIYKYLIIYWADLESDLSDSFDIAVFIRQIYNKYYVIEKKILKPIGFFKELDYGYSNGESIKANINKTPYDNSEKIINYLKNGLEYLTSLGMAEDYFNNDELIGPPDILTDGEYAWPRPFAYYVENYYVKISQDFLDHMEKQGWNVPQEKDIDLNNLQFLS